MRISKAFRGLKDIANGFAGKFSKENHDVFERLSSFVAIEAELGWEILGIKMSPRLFTGILLTGISTVLAEVVLMVRSG